MPAPPITSVLLFTSSCRQVASTQQPGRHIRGRAGWCLQQIDNISQEHSGTAITQWGKKPQSFAVWLRSCGLSWVSGLSLYITRRVMLAARLVTVCCAAMSTHWTDPHQMGPVTQLNHQLAFADDQMPLIVTNWCKHKSHRQAPHMVHHHMHCPAISPHLVHKGMPAVLQCV